MSPARNGNVCIYLQIRIFFHFLSLLSINSFLIITYKKDIIKLLVKKFPLSSLHLEFEICIKISFFVNDNAE